MLEFYCTQILGVRMKKVCISFVMVLNVVFANPISNNNLNTGEDVFKTYCWGCHHQTSVAFGPSFAQIANTRTRGEIQGQIVSPQSMYEQLGYERTAMPAFGNTLSQKEIDLIADFIVSFKGAI